MTYPFVDLALARRLERTEADACAKFVLAHGRVFPAIGAEWIDVGGTWAMYDGPASPLTQTFGLGVFTMPTDEDFDRLERFFTDRGAPVVHEVSPLAPQEILATLTGRGYRPVEVTSVLFRPISDEPEPGAPNEAIAIRRMKPDEGDRWADVSIRGWMAEGEMASFFRDLGPVTAAREDTVSLFGEIDGVPIAAASMTIHENVALMAGACTVPEARGRGAQFALHHHRLGLARRMGCDLTMMGAHPGTASQRNAERNGFRIAYTRTKWQKG